MQIRLIVADTDYNPAACFKLKSENAGAGDGKVGGAVGSHVEKFARDYCPQDPDIELIIRATNKVKELFWMRLPDMPRSKLVQHVKTWMVCCASAPLQLVFVSALGFQCRGATLIMQGDAACG